MTLLSSWMPYRRTQVLPIPPKPPEPPWGDHHGEDSGEMQRRDRLAIYRDPSPINRPPDYVLDLLEDGIARPRRLKPLARRVVILPELL
jgi:hypothetical protein